MEETIVDETGAYQDEGRQDRVSLIAVIIMVPVLYCPSCKSVLETITDKHCCHYCGNIYPIVNGIPLFINPDAALAGDSFDASAFEFLFEMEQKHFWHIGRREIILDILKRTFQDTSQSSILEVGCGNGSVLAYLKQNGVNVEGGDLFTEALRFCQRRIEDVSLYQLDVLSLPFRNCFDVIGLFDVLEHIEDDEKALREVRQALKPGGKVLITAPAHRFLWSYADESGHHQRRYGRKELVNKLDQSGFTVITISYFIIFLFPIMLLIRLINNYLLKNRLRHSRRARIEFKTVPVINGIFIRLLRIEKLLMRHIDLPFGASLIVLAEKNIGEML